ncbi:MAG: hypothetical protein ACK4R6_01665 [Spirosomataceae bacterium]
MFARIVLFELILLFLSIFPTLTYALYGNTNGLDIGQNSGIYVYLVVNTLFYFLSFWLNFLDSKKVFYSVIQPVTQRIRLIWALYMCYVGLLLFWGTEWFPSYELQRIFGVGISLFFFVSSNFRLNLHPSSAFAGGIGMNTSAGVKETTKMQQRSFAYLFFYLGIFMTILFFILPSVNLLWGNVFLGLSVFYGVVLRLFKTAMQNE